eukprot:5938633-Pyramimonas_sp.AAC.1
MEVDMIYVEPHGTRSTEDSERPTSNALDPVREDNENNLEEEFSFEKRFHEMFAPRDFSPLNCYKGAPKPGDQKKKEPKPKPEPVVEIVETGPELTDAETQTYMFDPMYLERSIAPKAQTAASSTQGMVRVAPPKPYFAN